MIVVTGHLVVDPEGREGYLATCAEVVAAARTAAGCLDFALGADLVDPARINILELWRDRASLDAFRGDGPSDDQQDQILGADVREYDVP